MGPMLHPGTPRPHRALSATCHLGERSVGRPIPALGCLLLEAERDGTAGSPSQEPTVTLLSPRNEGHVVENTVAIN